MAVQVVWPLRDLQKNWRMYRSEINMSGIKQEYDSGRSMWVVHDENGTKYSTHCIIWMSRLAAWLQFPSLIAEHGIDYWFFWAAQRGDIKVVNGIVNNYGYPTAPRADWSVDKAGKIKEFWFDCVSVAYAVLFLSVAFVLLFWVIET